MYLTSISQKTINPSSQDLIFKVKQGALKMLQVLTFWNQTPVIKHIVMIATRYTNCLNICVKLLYLLIQGKYHIVQSRVIKNTA